VSPPTQDQCSPGSLVRNPSGHISSRHFIKPFTKKVEVSTDRVFRDVTISVDTRGRTAISWELMPNVRETGPYEFYVDFSRYGFSTDNLYWETLNPDSPATDTFGVVLDSTTRRHTLSNESVYRVRMVACGKEFHSPAQRAFGILDTRLRAVYRDLIRKESLNTSPRRGASSGVLLKRKIFGPRCPVCTDKNTGHVVDHHCSNCFGTGVVGGYFPPYEYNINFSNTDVYGAKVTDLGTQDQNVKVGRGVIFPFPAPKDVWIELGTGRAFKFMRIEVAAHLQTKPVAVKVAIAQAPATDPIYFLLGD